MSKRKTQEEVIENAKKVHGNEYDYSKVIYKNAKTPIVVICPKHGEFHPTPDNHINKGRKCPKCANNKKLTTQEFVEKAKEIHGDKYDYSKAIYKSAHDPITVICPIHGEFEQIARVHHKGHGCKKCAAKEITLEEDSFWEQVVNTQVNRNFDYTKTEFINASSNITVTCPIHGDWVTKAGNHARGCNCPFCSSTSFKLGEPATLYYVKIIGTSIYKIGITNRTLKERFSAEKDYEKIEVIKEFKFDLGKDAYDFEQQIIKVNKKFLYKGEKLLHSGNTELFIKDILGLDT